MKLCINSFALLFIVLGQVFPQSIEGDWYGKAEIDGIVLRLTVHVKTDGQAYSSTWDSPDQGAFGIPSTTTRFSYPEFSFTHSGAGFAYTGQVNPSYTSIGGFLEQGGRKIEIVFGRGEIKAARNSPEELKKKYSKRKFILKCATASGFSLQYIHPVTAKDPILSFLTGLPTTLNPEVLTIIIISCKSIQDTPKRIT